MEKLITIVTLLIAVSVASERLVEIIKGFSPFLNTEKTDVNLEGRRKSYLHILAVISGIVTALLARSVINDVFDNLYNDVSHALTILAVGLLASGGSGFWNSILTYLLKVKDIKDVEADKAKKLKNVEIAKAQIAVGKAEELKNLEVEKAWIEVEKAKKLLAASPSNGTAATAPAVVNQ